MKGKIYFLDLNRDFATAAVVLVGILEASHAELFYEIYWAKVVSGMVHKRSGNGKCTMFSYFSPTKKCHLMKGLRNKILN